MTRDWLWVLLSTVILLALGFGIYTLAAPKGLELHGTPMESPSSVRDVTQLGVDGGLRHLGQWEGKLALVFFGYANCPDVCPLTMAKLAQTYRELGEPDDLQVVMVTVDPKRETPQQIHDFARRFHPDFVGLTGTAEMIAVASARFYVGSREVPSGSVAHSSHLTLLDRQGRMRLLYTQDKLDGRLQEDLETLLAYEGPW